MIRRKWWRLGTVEDLDDAVLQLDPAGRQAGAARLVDLYAGNSFGSQVGEIKATRGQGFAAAAEARCRHLAAVEEDERVAGANAAEILGNGH